jgi:hypothetical protein
MAITAPFFHESYDYLTVVSNDLPLSNIPDWLRNVENTG